MAIQTTNRVASWISDLDENFTPCERVTLPTPDRTLQTPPAPDETWDSTQQLWAQRPNASTHSADLLHHDKSTALLAGLNNPQPQWMTWGEQPSL
jgi:hypothetical protein